MRPVPKTPIKSSLTRPQLARPKPCRRDIKVHIIQPVHKVANSLRIILARGPTTSTSPSQPQYSPPSWTVCVPFKTAVSSPPVLDTTSFFRCGVCLISRGDPRTALSSLHHDHHCNLRFLLCLRLHQGQASPGSHATQRPEQASSSRVLSQDHPEPAETNPVFA